MLRKFKKTKRRWRERWRNLYASERHFVRLGIGGLLVFTLGWVGWRVLREPFEHWRGRQALSQAERFLHQQDYRDALLALKRATLLMPNDPATWRTVARHLDELDLPETLVAHKNIVQLDPMDTRQRLALARQALRFDDAELAAKTMDALPAGVAESEEYHRLAAALALSVGRDRDYVKHLRALLALTPGDPGARFNLAVVDLWSGDPLNEVEARRDFAALLALPEMRVRAALELLKDAARRHDASAATQTAKEIDAAFPSSPELAAQPPGWDRLRAKLKLAATNPMDVALLARWFGSIGVAGEALVWIEHQPLEIQSHPSVRDAAVILSILSKDPERLAHWLSSDAWGELPDRFIKLISHADLVKSGGVSTTSRAAWLGAFAAAQDSVASLRVMARLAAIWRNEEENERALKALIRLAPHDQWAYQGLQSLYTDQGRTGSMFDLYGAWRKIEPGNLTIVGHWWVLAALLDRLPEDAELDIRKLLVSAPQKPAVAIAAAAVLWRLENYPAALESLDKLSAEDSARSEVAFWLGVIGAETNDPRAGGNLVNAGNDPSWLPEQQGLLRIAREKEGLN